MNSKVINVSRSSINLQRKAVGQQVMSSVYPTV